MSVKCDGWGYCTNSTPSDFLAKAITSKPRYRKMYPGFVHSTTTLIPKLNRSPKSGGEKMKMDERYSNASYGSAGLAAFFASLSLQDWGFIIGVAFSIILGVLTYRLNKREQMKRTKILQDILNKTDSRNPSATATVIAELGQKAPKEI